MKSYRQLKDGSLELIENNAIKASSPAIFDDIRPYKSMQTGEMIMSRSQHRRHLHQHNLIEVGNDYSTAPKKDFVKEKQEAFNLRREIWHIVDSKR